MTTKMLSLYDFLGRAAGGALGKEVAETAKQRNIKLETRYVQNKKYSGEVLLYPESFLKEYFGSEANRVIK